MDSALARPYRAVFFDLDGTLLPMELEEFIGPYFETLARFGAIYGLEPEPLISIVNNAVKKEIANDTGKLNARVFWDEFFAGAEASGIAPTIPWGEFFDGYYAGDYRLIGKNVRANPAAKSAIEKLTEKGYPLILATLPLFPLVAVEQRLAWAGLDPSVFRRITTMDNSSAAKPSLDYYTEIFAACGLEGKDVLMVGNNTVEDFAAVELGCGFYLVTDHLIDPVGFDLDCVDHGSLVDFADWIDGLPTCENPVREVKRGPMVEDDPSAHVLLGAAERM